MIPFFKKKEFFSAEEKQRIIAAIRSMEQQTSGEIRVYVEHKNPYVDSVERAKEKFHQLNMQNTKHRNAVLLYLAIKHRELAVFADEGIYKATSTGYWDNAVKKMIAAFKGGDICKGIEVSIYIAGEVLKEKFPYDQANDKPELSDNIIYGE